MRPARTILIMQLSNSRVGFVKVRDTSHPVADQDALLYGLENGVYFHEFHYNTFGQGWG